ncbi:MULTISPECIES: YeaC family protein [unclassified Agarivorans]|uniref:YeaC family protein n=1 Tax=unclassified Agarivorans TaxID=2636026 RepID=UPI003D7DA929
MDVEKLLAAMSPEIYQNMLNAVETGRWPDGKKLNAEQRDHTQQLVILYQAKHNHQPQHFTVGTDGELVMKSKQELKRQYKDEQVIVQLTQS